MESKSVMSKPTYKQLETPQVLSFGGLIVINLLWREQVASQLGLFTKIIIRSLN